MLLSLWLSSCCASSKDGSLVPTLLLGLVLLPSLLCPWSKDGRQVVDESVVLCQTKCSNTTTQGTARTILLMSEDGTHMGTFTGPVRTTDAEVRWVGRPKSKEFGLWHRVGRHLDGLSGSFPPCSVFSTLPVFKECRIHHWIHSLIWMKPQREGCYRLMITITQIIPWGPPLSTWQPLAHTAVPLGQGY